mmetsp:Transcript_59384/g.89570  ORF Transcript_59384/g.89570 Transcript_59384/m.89570 type:complete len:103 (+) Transcript_59384:237-545(+)
MRSLPVLLLVLLISLCFDGSHAFTTKKRERRHAFKSAPGVNEAREASHEDQTPVASMVALPTTSSAAATVPVQEEEVDVSYGVAMVSCMLSLAVGFGLGYGT